MMPVREANRMKQSRTQEPALAEIPCILTAQRPYTVTKSDAKAELIGNFRDTLSAIAQLGPNVGAAQNYVNQRTSLLNDEHIGPLLPLFVVECRTERDFWNYISTAFSGSGAYASRTKYITEQLLPVERQLRPDRMRLPGDRPAEIRIEYSPVRPTSSGGLALISDDRIAELRTANSPDYSLVKLIRFCEEANTTYGEGCYLATIMLIRSILDHIPPLFGMNTFGDVASQCGGGGKSFKEAMQRLEQSARKIGDAHLHTRIRKAEVLPSMQQVSFGPELDTLLGEFVRILAA